MFTINTKKGSTMKVTDIINEGSEENLTLVKALTEIFIRYFFTAKGRQEIKKIQDLYYDGLGTQFTLHNPYEEYSDYKKIVKTVRELRLPDAFIDRITEIKFVVDFSGYEFDAGDGQKLQAGGAYDPSKHQILFYSIPAITNDELVAHELRHMVQFSTYEIRRRMTAHASGKVEKTKKYFEMPVELDAYWTGVFVETIIMFDIPYSSDKGSILSISKEIHQKFKNQLRNQLSKKNENHYWKKTVKAVYGLSILQDAGVELEIEEIRKFVTARITQDSEELEKLRAMMDSADDPAEGEKLAMKFLDLKDKNFYMSDIPKFKPSSEPVGSMFAGAISPPRRISARARNFDKFQVLLYLAAVDEKNSYKKYVFALERVENDTINNIIYDLIDEFIVDPKNQIAVRKFLINKLP